MQEPGRVKGLLLFLQQGGILTGNVPPVGRPFAYYNQRGGRRPRANLKFIHPPQGSRTHDSGNAPARRWP